MATSTTISGLPVPEGSDANNVPSDMSDLADAIDGTIVKKLTSAQIAALDAGERPAGTYFHNSTTGRLMVSTGAAVVDVGAWQSWTCTVTASSSNPTDVVQRSTEYMRLGGLVIARAIVTIPLATKGSGTYAFSLPVAPDTDYNTFGGSYLSLGGAFIDGVAYTTIADARMSAAATVGIWYGASAVAFSSTDVSGDDKTCGFQVTYQAT